MPILSTVVDGVLRLVAIVATLLVVAGFALFARDQMSHASHQQVTYLAHPGPNQEHARESRHSSLRETVDDANDTLLKPFAGVTTAHNEWVRRGIPTLLALLVYGLGLGFLARYLRVRS